MSGDVRRHAQKRRRVSARRKIRSPSQDQQASRESDSVESKVENEMLSVKMRLVKKKRSDGIKSSLELALRSKSAMMPRKQLPKPHTIARERG